MFYVLIWHVMFTFINSNRCSNMGLFGCMIWFKMYWIGRGSTWVAVYKNQYVLPISALRTFILMCLHFFAREEYQKGKKKKYCRKELFYQMFLWCVCILYPSLLQLCQYMLSTFLWEQIKKCNLNFFRRSRNDLLRV